MIAVDSSIVVAIMRGEPDAALWTDTLDRAAKSIMSVVSYLETNMVIAGRRTGADPAQIDTLLGALCIDVVPATVAHGSAAITAFMTYGKERHPARLNLADCFSYALAKTQNIPLLFKGYDFVKTDIIPASFSAPHHRRFPL